MNVLDLFSGIGGLGEAARDGLAELGIHARTIAYCEREPFAQAVLLSRMHRGEIDAAPIWDDVTTLGRPGGGEIPKPVDLLIGGWPCQGNSVAGLRRGMEDERSGLVREVIRLVGDLRPSGVFLENVSGVLTAPGDGVGYVLRELARLGYDARWTCLSAAETGAAHTRNRFWILAHRQSGGQRERGSASGSAGHADSGDEGMGHATVPGLQKRRSARPQGEGAVERRGGEVGDAEVNDQRPGLRESGPAGYARFWRGRSGHTGGPPLPPSPPPPNDRDAWAEVIRACPEAQPAIRRVANGLPHWNDRLRALGNSVDYFAARAAIKILMGKEER